MTCGGEGTEQIHRAETRNAVDQFHPAKSAVAKVAFLVLKEVRFTRWMFVDIEHDDEAENTTRGRAENWRATEWVIHRVTAFKVCTAGPTNCE